MENRIQELRKSRGISQADLADMMCVTRQTIISLEKGRYNASLELAYKLATFFNLTIEDVFCLKRRENEMIFSDLSVLLTQKSQLAYAKS
ncbi:helix-turn-helix transcriptional regulator [Streptococcus equi]|uniref:helix-turn-helix transcriptional regulator n=1 Tax=Streptococcus equi TaxID=1336 RepID=UPI001E46A17B|nr:helix-turn-helix transcriptional regulator [Streptococcus equi]